MKVLILGSKGLLGQQLLKVFEGSVGWDREEADVTDAAALRTKILEARPEAVINCVAFNDVDGAEENRHAAYLLNAEVVGEIAKITKELGIPLVHFSSNYVFDGEAGEYDESALPAPLSVYARSKLEGENLLAENTDKYYLVRTSVIFGPKGESRASKKSFVDLMLQLSESVDVLNAVSDEFNSVTYSLDLAAAVKELVEGKKPYGIYHITNSGSASWYELAQEIFRITGKDVKLTPVPSEAFPRKALRPKKAVLVNTKLPNLRSWQEALKEFLTKAE